MKPIGPLMWEHRLIERLVKLLGSALSDMKQTSKANSEFLTVVTDFFRTYADRTHHGKEEDILFRELEKKPLSAEHKKIMGELIEQHMRARKLVTSLIDANQKYKQGNQGSLKDILEPLTELVNFYPAHIEIEDKHFFFPVLDYFTPQEQDTMLQEFWEFDRKLIHEKYQKIVDGLESTKV